MFGEHFTNVQGMQIRPILLSQIRVLIILIRHQIKLGDMLETLKYQVPNKPNLEIGRMYSKLKIK